MPAPEHRIPHARSPGTTSVPLRGVDVYLCPDERSVCAGGDPGDLHAAIKKGIRSIPHTEAVRRVGQDRSIDVRSWMRVVGCRGATSGNSIDAGHVGQLNFGDRASTHPLRQEPRA